MAETSKVRRFTVCTNAIVLVLGLAFVTFGVLLFKMQGELVRGISDAYESGRTAVQGGDKQTDQVQDDINEAYANTLGQLKLDTLGLAIAGLGGLMVLISFLGCCGAKAESRPLLCAYITFTSLFIVAASAVSGVLLYTAVDLASTHTDPASAACKLAVDAKGPEANAAALKELGSEVYFDCNLAHSYALLQAQLLRANRRLAIPLVGDVASTSYVAFQAAPRSRRCGPRGGLRRRPAPALPLRLRRLRGQEAGGGQRRRPLLPGDLQAAARQHHGGAAAHGVESLS